MMKEKGVWDLLEACKLLKEKQYKYYCNFVGKWSDITKEEFTSKVLELGLQNEVNGAGAKYGNEKKVFFENADVLVFPTFYHGETFGLVLLEAMEYALPCISTNEGGIPSVISDGETGILVDKRSPMELADKLIYLIEHPDLCISMGKSGKERFLKEFTLESFEKRLVAILNDCIS